MDRAVESIRIDHSGALPDVATKILEKQLQEIGVELAAPGVRVRYMPDAASLRQCRALGATVGARLMEKCDATV